MGLIFNFPSTTLYEKMSLFRSNIDLESTAIFRGVPCIISFNLKIKCGDKISQENVKIKSVSIKPSMIESPLPSYGASPLMLADDSRYYLNVPIGEKDAAKILGAKWDNLALKWYIQLDLSTGKCAKTGNPISAFARWDPRHAKPSLPTPSFTSPESIKKHQSVVTISVSSDSDSSSNASPKIKIKKEKKSPKKLRVREDSEDDSDTLPPTKKPKMPTVSHDDDEDSFIAEEEELSPSEVQTLEQERLTVGKRCYGCAALDVPHVCGVEDCFKDSCVMHVIVCKFCKNTFCDDHGRAKNHECKGRK